MRIISSLTLIFIFFCTDVFSTNIRVLDLQKTIESNASLSILYNQIIDDQKSHNPEFNNEELNLKKELDRIEKLNLILDPSELELEIESYNK